MKFFQAGMQTLLVRVSLIGIAFFSGVINARYLGPENLGILTLLLLIPNTCFRFGNLGLGSGLSFFASKQEMSSRRAISISIAASLLLSLLSALGLFVTMWFGYSPWEDINIFFVILMLIITPFFFAHNFLQRVVSGFLLITKHNISEILLAVINLAGLLLLVVALGYGLHGSLFAFMLAEVVVALYLFVSLMKNAREIKTSCHEKLSFSTMWNYCKWNYLTLLNKFLFDQIPLFVLNYFVPFAQVGIYAVGKNLATRAMIIPDTFSNVLFPYNSNIEVKLAKQRTDTVVRNFLVIMCLIVIILFVMSKPFIELLYGNQYQESVLLFRLTLPTLIFFPVYKFQIVHLTSVGLSREASMVSFFSLPIVCLLSGLLIPTYGAVGACISLSATNCLLAMISMFFYLKYTGSHLGDVLKFTENDFALYREVYMKISRKKV